MGISTKGKYLQEWQKEGRQVEGVVKVMGITICSGVRTLRVEKYG